MRKNGYPGKGSEIWTGLGSSLGIHGPAVRVEAFRLKCNETVQICLLMKPCDAFSDLVSRSLGHLCTGKVSYSAWLAQVAFEAIETKHLMAIRGLASSTPLRSPRKPLTKKAGSGARRNSKLQWAVQGYLWRMDILDPPTAMEKKETFKLPD